MTENLSPDTLADGAVNTPADGGGTVESPALTLEELNKHLGSDFKDSATALKALKDTKDFVGKRKEDIAAEVLKTMPQSQPDESLKSDVHELKNQLFFSNNPQYKDYAPLISKMGENPAEVVESTEFKSVFEKVVKADEVAQAKSVVASNSRISSPQSVVENAVNTANARGTTQEDVALVFARGINDMNRGE